MHLGLRTRHRRNTNVSRERIIIIIVVVVVVITHQYHTRLQSAVDGKAQKHLSTRLPRRRRRRSRHRLRDPFVAIAHRIASRSPTSAWYSNVSSVAIARATPAHRRRRPPTAAGTTREVAAFVVVAFVFAFAADARDGAWHRTTVVGFIVVIIVVVVVVVVVVVRVKSCANVTSIARMTRAPCMHSRVTPRLSSQLR